MFLSGGASFGKYHLGVIKALYENDLLPRIVVGSSAGSFMCCMLASLKYSQVWELLVDQKFVGPIWNHHTNSMLEFMRYVINGEPLSDHKNIKKHLRNVVGDLTFSEIYE